jgi:hypothetical protein
MSASDKPDLARGWLRAEKLLEQEADRLATISDEDFEREMDALPDPARVPTAEELLARGAARAEERLEGTAGTSGAKVTALPVRSRTASRMVWLVAAALGALVIAVVVLVLRRDDVALPYGQTQQQRADELREGAYAACDKGQWRACEDQLDDAKKLDPAGDAAPRVQAARAAAIQGLHPETGRH